MMTQELNPTGIFCITRPRDLRSGADETPRYNIAVKIEGFQRGGGGFNLVSMMSRDFSLSDSCTADCCGKTTAEKKLEKQSGKNWKNITERTYSCPRD